MHAEAFQWVKQFRMVGPVTVLDLGGRNVNGTPRELFPNAAIYTVVDIAPGPGVDFVADAATWVPDREYDLVLSTECFEHTYSWPEICATAFKACKPGGMFVATMAGPGRAPHSGLDGGSTLYAGEEYGNVKPARLQAVLEALGWREIVVDQQVSPASCDVRCSAIR